MGASTSSSNLSALVPEKGFALLASPPAALNGEGHEGEGFALTIAFSFELRLVKLVQIIVGEIAVGKATRSLLGNTLNIH